MWNLWWTKWQLDRIFLYTSLSSVSIIPPKLHKHVDLIRITNGRNLENLQRTTPPPLGILGKLEEKKVGECLIFLSVKCEWLVEVFKYSLDWGHFITYDASSFKISFFLLCSNWKKKPLGNYRRMSLVPCLSITLLSTNLSNTTHM
jgi:hypothetical protein